MAGQVMGDVLHLLLRKFRLSHATPIRSFMKIKMGAVLEGGPPRGGGPL